MAIEVNKRKRKYQPGEEGVDDGEVEVPKKIAKNQKTPKKPNKKKIKVKKQKVDGQEASASPDLESRNEEQEEASVEHDSGFDEKDIKFPKDFKMMHFRGKLRGNNFITELRHFLHVIQSRPRMVAKYIEKRGKPLELAEALERINKTNVLHVAYICQALQLVLMEILANQKEHMESAVHACRYFLKSHGAVLDVLLKSAQLQHRRVALKLLTAIVCVEPQLGRQVLASYDILSNVKTIENFLSHSQYELHEEETVRKCFIHFVLAYLVDGNTLLIRNILDRGALIRALASGLLYDDHVTVCVVLSTLQKYVLECAEISKTKKIHVFDSECCRHFARLYDWNGPKVYAAKFAGKGGSQVNLQAQQIEALVDEKEREAVSSAVHEFLVVLLTSRKYGITFDAVTYFRQRHNAIQGKVIGFLYKPWCSERKTELVLKILNACPDLSRHTVRNFASIVNPMRTPQRDWVAAAEFLTKIISTLHPKLLRSAFDKITLTDCTYWIKDICLPIETLVLLTGSKMLRHKNFQFRLATNRLLLAMFTQYSNYMAAINKREQARGNVNSLRRFKFDILNHILVNFPTVEDMLFSLYMSIKTQDAEDVSVLAHLDVTLDLLLVICREHRSFVNKTNTILDYLELLRPLYANEDLVEPADASNIKLELKAIKTILLLFPKALKPEQKLFSSVLKSFIKAFIHGTVEVQREAGELLRHIFINTGLFDAAVLEVDLWLESLRFCDAETADVVTQVFIEVFQVTKAEVEAPKSTETVVNEKNLHKLFENIENGLSVQAYIETIFISKLMPLIFKGVDIVPPLDKYLETVCLLMFHYYPIPDQVRTLYEMEFSTLSKYMCSWLPASADELQLEDITTKHIPYLINVQRALLQGEQKFDAIFDKCTADENTFELTLNDTNRIKLNVKLRNERLVMIYVQQALFLVAQLVEKQKLQRKQAEAIALFLINCIQLVNVCESELAKESDDRAEKVSYVSEMLRYIYSLRLTHIRSMELFTAANESHLNYLIFLRMLTENCNAMEHFDMHAANYRLKIVKAVAISVNSSEETKAQSENLSEFVKLVESFQLHVEECTEILELIGAQLKYSDFFIAVERNPPRKTIYYDLLVCVLQRLASLQKAVRCDLFIKKIVKLYTHFVKHFGIDTTMEQLEDAFHNFLVVSHQYVPQLGVKFFNSMFIERRLTKSTIKLACLVLERNDKLHEEFIKLLPENINKRELVYPLLSIVLQKVPLDNALLQNVYQVYKSGFMKTIEKPQKAGVIYKEHVNCSIILIEQCMPRSECLDFCNRNFKFDAIEIYQIRTIHAIYRKALTTVGETNSKQKYTIFVNFINLQVQMLSVDLKKQTLDMEKVKLFAYLLYEWWNLHSKSTAQAVEDDAAEDFNKITKSQQWLNFCKFCLKLGMHISETEVELQKTEELCGLVLKLLAYLCDQLYTDFQSDANVVEAPPEPAQLFEMIFTHSKFYDIVLSHRASLVKTEVLHLLYTVSKKNPSALNDKQIPFILGAYQATLSTADRYALALLELYELYDCGLQRYRPFIWGESAVAFYALRAADEERVKLSQQETSIAQVMSLIDRQQCEYTIDNFPIWRKLNARQQMPIVEFHDPSFKAFVFGSNELERRIERGITAFTEADLRLCPKREGIYEQCYDPAFFIPLMSMCFAPESYVHPARPVQNGLLSMVFAALSSQDRDMRLAAGCVQLRYRAHFESSKFFERPLWIQAYDNIQSGLSDLRDAWMKHKKNSGTPRVPFISGLFVAKTFNLTTDPTHLLYKQLTMYLRLKSSFNFQCVPEFNVLFYSAEIEHQAFRQFIVEVIRNGIKSSSDLFLLVTTNTFKVLMGFYGSAISTLDMNLLILSVFSTCVKIPASSKIMIEHVGILPWLNSVVSTVEFHHFDIIEGLISIVSNLWYAIKANAQQFHNLTHIFLELHQLVLRILPHLSARISAANFAKLLNVLQKTCSGHQMAMPATQLDHLIACAEKHYPTLVHSIENIRTFGGFGASSHVEYCRFLQNQQADSNAILALSSLRAYVIDWWKCHHANLETSQTEIEI